MVVGGGPEAGGGEREGHSFPLKSVLIAVSSDLL